ncbi:unnamed protein product [[Candida] boidinii]|uniref:Unnamed protein product n=1 Tax=Candida boidinii TaxID=5477 RepID=A0ACB5TPK9_CANBO|nr:unnamed protein product [[Candida] boidinii]GME99571.1 unnamed protein product [[Candida] boidinii]
MSPEMCLNSGYEIPNVGFGTFRASEEDTYNSVLTALKNGYKHIDTAYVYRNESSVGKAIKDSGVPREELFITTKLWNTDHRKPLESLDASLKRLGLDYVDLYLMHWPVPFHPAKTEEEDQFFVVNKSTGEYDNDLEWDFIKTYELMQELVPTGKTRSVGVSNFSKTNLEKLLNSANLKIKPACNQVELHPFLPQFDLLEFCKTNDIQLEAYAPLGSHDSNLMNDDIIKTLSEKLDVSPATLLVSWAVWRGTVPLPKSVTESRIISNIKIIDLDEEVGGKIDEISKIRGEKRLFNRNWGIPVFD